MSEELAAWKCVSGGASRIKDLKQESLIVICCREVIRCDDWATRLHIPKRLSPSHCTGKIMTYLRHDRRLGLAFG